MIFTRPGSAQFFYLLAISKINVAAAILLHYTGPEFVALYVVLVQRKNLSVKSKLAITGKLIGCFLLSLCFLSKSSAGCP